MKEELKQLKEVAIQIAKETDGFRKQKNFFNMKVEEKKSELNMEEIFNEENEDSFESAEILNFLFPQIHTIVSSVREGHPKYGEKRIKEIAVVALKEFMSLNEYMLSFYDQIDVVVDNYFLYESCGYFKLLERKESLSKLEETAKGTTDVVLNQSKEAAKKFGSDVANIVKPYGEVAKGQFNEAKVVGKDLINKGSKKLIKILEDLENKTKTK